MGDEAENNDANAAGEAAAEEPVAAPAADQK